MKIISDDIASFSLTLDSGVLEKQTLILLRTLRDNYPKSPILTFVTASEGQITQSIYDEFCEKTTVEHGDIPISDYPLSAFQEAFRRAEERFNTQYTIAIDSDCVVFDKLSVPAEEADLYATRQYMGVWPWQTADGSQDDWKLLFEKFKIEPPENGTNGLTDDYPMWPPYYNGGVLITTNGEIPEKLLDYNKNIYDNNFTDKNPRDETEQVALALIAQEYNTEELDKNQNYMMGAHTTIPDEVSVVHYLSLETLSTISNETLLKKLRDTGVELKPRKVDSVSRVLGTFVFQGGKYVPKDFVRWYSENIVSRLYIGDETKRVDIKF